MERQSATNGAEAVNRHCCREAAALQRTVAPWSRRHKAVQALQTTPRASPRAVVRRWSERPTLRAAESCTGVRVDGLEAVTAVQGSTRLGCAPHLAVAHLREARRQQQLCFEPCHAAWLARVVPACARSARLGSARLGRARPGASHVLRCQPRTSRVATASASTSVEGALFVRAERQWSGRSARVEHGDAARAIGDCEARAIGVPTDAVQ